MRVSCGSSHGTLLWPPPRLIGPCRLPPGDMRCVPCGHPTHVLLPGSEVPDVPWLCGRACVSPDAGRGAPHGMWTWGEGSLG